MGVQDDRAASTRVEASSRAYRSLGGASVGRPSGMMMVMERDLARIIAEGLAASAVTLLEMMPEDVDTVRSQLVEKWRECGSPANAFRDAAAAVSTLPQPELEPAETKEKMRPIREALGVTSAEEQLNAALGALGILRSLSEQYH